MSVLLFILQCATVVKAPSWCTNCLVFNPFLSTSCKEAQLQGEALEILKQKKQNDWSTLLWGNERRALKHLQRTRTGPSEDDQCSFGHWIKNIQSPVLSIQWGTVFLFPPHPWLKLLSELRSNYQSSFKMSITPLLVKKIMPWKTSVQV